MEEVEDEILVLKMDVDVMGIRMSSTEKDVAKAQEDVRMLESSVDNSHLRLEEVEDWVDGCVSSAQSQTRLCMTNTWLMGLEIQRVQGEWRKGHEDLLKLLTTGDVIDWKFVCLDEELERVVELVGQKVEAITLGHEEAMVAEEAKRVALEVRVEELDQRLRDTVILLQSFSNHLTEVEDVIMESNAEGEVAASSSSSDIGLVENMMAIPIPGPLVIHTLTPVPDAYIPPSVHSSPSPLYLQAQEEDPVHSGVPEFWAGPDV